MLNLDPKYIDLFKDEFKNVVALFNFGLGNEVKIENRTVKSLPVLFGDVLGLREFMTFFASMLLSYYTESAQSLSQVGDTFRILS